MHFFVTFFVQAKKVKKLLLFYIFFIKENCKKFQFILTFFKDEKSNKKIFLRFLFLEKKAWQRKKSAAKFQKTNTRTNTCNKHNFQLNALCFLKNLHLSETENLSLLNLALWVVILKIRNMLLIGRLLVMSQIRVQNFFFFD